MRSLPTLPLAGKLHVFVSVERFTDRSMREGDAAERGWTDDIGSTVIEDSRNYVQPTLSVDVNDDFLPVEVANLLNTFGPVDSVEDGNHYAQTDWHKVLNDEGVIIESWRYTLHAFVKRFGPKGWEEMPVDLTELT